MLFDWLAGRIGCLFEVRWSTEWNVAQSVEVCSILLGDVNCIAFFCVWCCDKVLLLQCWSPVVSCSTVAQSREKVCQLSIERTDSFTDHEGGRGGTDKEPERRGTEWTIGDRQPRRRTQMRGEAKDDREQSHTHTHA